MVASEVGGVAIGNVQLSAAREAKPASRRRGERKRTAFLGGPGVGSLDGEAWSVRGHESTSDATDRVDRLRKLLRRAQSFRVTDLYTKGIPGDYYHVSDATPGDRLGGAPGSRPWAVSIERDPDPFIVLEAEDHDTRHIGATADTTASPGGSDGKRVRYTPDTVERIVAKLGSSLVLLLRLEANANDFSGLANNGTLVGAPTFVAGKVGNGVDLNGTTQEVTVADHATINPTQAVSFEAWVKLDALLAAGSYIVGRSGVGNLSIEASGAVSYAGPSTLNTAAGVIATAQWYHVVTTYDRVTQAIYVNGALKASSAQTAAIPTGGVMRIGSFNGASGWVDGIIDEFRMYDRALTKDEVTWRYENTKDGTRPSNDHRAPLDQALDLDERSWRIRARVQNRTTNTGKYRIQAIDSAGADIGSAPAQVTPSAAGAWEVLELQAALAIPAAKAGANMLLLKCVDPTNTNGMDLDCLEVLPA